MPALRGGVGVVCPEEEVDRGQNEECRRQFRPRVGGILDEERIDHEEQREDAHRAGPVRLIAIVGDGMKASHQQRGRQVSQGVQQGRDDLVAREVDVGDAQKNTSDHVCQRRAGGEWIKSGEKNVARPPI